MNDNVRWCCSAFRNSFERLDERGSRVVAVVSGMFLLVFRSVDPEFIGTFTVPVPLSLVEDVPLNSGTTETLCQAGRPSEARDGTEREPAPAVNNLGVVTHRPGEV